MLNEKTELCQDVLTAEIPFETLPDYFAKQLRDLVIGWLVPISDKQDTYSLRAYGDVCFTLAESSS